MMMMRQRLQTILTLIILISNVTCNDEYDHINSSNQQIDDPSLSLSSSSSPPRDLQSSSPRYIAEVFECNELNEEITPDFPKERSKDRTLRICVIPNIRTLLRDVFIRNIQDFTLIKPGTPVSQPVVLEGSHAEAQDPPTLVHCIPGAKVCTMLVELKSEMFDVSGEVRGVGEVAMQFGRANNLRRGRRNLQLAGASGDFAGFSSISMSFQVQGSDAPSNDENFGDEVDNKVGNLWEDSPRHVRTLFIVAAIVLGFILCMGIILCSCFMSSLTDSNSKSPPPPPRRESSLSPATATSANDAANKDGGEDSSEKPSSQRPPSKRFSRRASNASQKGGNEAEEDNKSTAMSDISNHHSTSGYASSNIDYDDDVVDYDGNTIEPTEFDVCFDAEDHPGTFDFEKILLETVESKQGANYGPAVYRTIKKQLQGRNFFVCDNDEFPDQWRMVPKHELIDLFAKYYDAKKNELFSSSPSGASNKSQRQQRRMSSSSSNNIGNSSHHSTSSSKKRRSSVKKPNSGRIAVETVSSENDSQF